MTTVLFTEKKELQNQFKKAIYEELKDRQNIYRTCVCSLRKSGSWKSPLKTWKNRELVLETVTLCANTGTTVFPHNQRSLLIHYTVQAQILPFSVFISPPEAIIISENILLNSINTNGFICLQKAVMVKWKVSRWMKNRVLLCEPLSRAARRILCVNSQGV